jgi:exosortase J
MTEDLQVAQTAPAATLTASNLLKARKSRLLTIAGVVLLTAAGCLGIYREIASLWSVWTTDPLRSIGMLIPPASIFLTLRVWQHLNWQMRGTWWGLGVIGLSYTLSALRQKVVFFAVFGNATASLIPVSLPLYVYASGVVLLFAGTTVWRKAWFPIGLLMLAQPVPILAIGLIDIPLQNVSARVARSFATFIHFAPKTPQLRLMFSPDFGMFIAPGCDGIRGAVTMGYVAMILGYLKRVAWTVWVALVAGAVLLGYIFNFVRLCLLVVYYRIALGHPNLEAVAKQADYAIGSCLFLAATFLFLGIASRRPRVTSPEPGKAGEQGDLLDTRVAALRLGAFAVMLTAVLFLPTSALDSTGSGRFDANEFAARLPRQIGAFTLRRTWYEQGDGTPVVQAGAYSAPGSDEITLGVWIAPINHIHDAQACWLARGLEPQLLTIRPYRVRGGDSEPFNTGFYSDGITDSIVVSPWCTPESCAQYRGTSSTGRLGFVFLDQTSSIARSKDHPVSIMIRIDRLHETVPQLTTEDALEGEAERFIAGLDPNSLSRAFQ